MTALSDQPATPPVIDDGVAERLVAALHATATEIQSYQHAINRRLQAVQHRLDGLDETIAEIRSGHVAMSRRFGLIDDLAVRLNGLEEHIEGIKTHSEFIEAVTMAAFTAGRSGRGATGQPPTLFSVPPLPKRD